MFTDLTISKTIYLEDHGQDFLTWKINADGVVIDCKPCQWWMWAGYKVINHEHLKRGDQLLILGPHAQDVSKLSTLKYRAEKVVRERVRRTLFEVLGD